MEVDDEIEMTGVETTRQVEVIAEALPAPTVGCGHHRRHMCIVQDDGGGGVFDQIHQFGRRVTAPDRPDDRCREHHIADQAKTYQEDGQRSGFDGRLVHEHHWNVVLDGVHAPAGVALETRAIVHEVHWCLAVGTDQDFEKRRVDGHAETM
jgi:hypothetical protein